MQPPTANSGTGSFATEKELLGAFQALEMRYNQVQGEKAEALNIAQRVDDERRTAITRMQMAEQQSNNFLMGRQATDVRELQMQVRSMELEREKMISHVAQFENQLNSLRENTSQNMTSEKQLEELRTAVFERDNKIRAAQAEKEELENKYKSYATGLEVMTTFQFTHPRILMTQPLPLSQP